LLITDITVRDGEACGATRFTFRVTHRADRGETVVIRRRIDAALSPQQRFVPTWAAMATRSRFAPAPN